MRLIRTCVHRVQMHSHKPSQPAVTVGMTLAFLPHSLPTLCFSRPLLDECTPSLPGGTWQLFKMDSDLLLVLYLIFLLLEKLSLPL